jgi:fatty-acyl-CoA synthase
LRAGDYLNAVEGVRNQLSGVERFVALEGSRDGWLDYEGLIESELDAFVSVEIDEDDLITINYTSGTTARPKRVMITHRNAYLNVLGTLAHFQMPPEDRYLWTLPMFHANGWTFVWTVTARGSAHVCLRKVDPTTIFELVEREAITTLCAAPTVLIGIANAPEAVCKRAAGKVVRLLTAGAPPAAVTIELIERGLGWNVTHIYGLTETSPFILICEELPEHRTLPLAERVIVKARQGVELVSSGEIRVLDTSGQEVPSDGQTLGEICVRGNVVMKGYFHERRRNEKSDRRRMVSYRRRGSGAFRRICRDPRPIQRRDHQRRGKHLIGGGRERVASPRCGAGGFGRRHALSQMGRSGACICRAASWQNRHRSRNHPICA